MNSILESIQIITHELKNITTVLGEKEKKEEEEKKEKIQENKDVNADINVELLAKRLAYTYVTRHPEYSTESQFKNIKDMINSDKITYIISWLRKNVEGIEDFFELSKQEKVYLLNSAITNHESKIKSVLKERFKHD